MQSRNLLFALGIGLSVGAGVALLFAPQSGAATRKKIKRGAEDAGDYLEDTAAYLKEQAENLTVEAQELAKKAGATVDEALQQAGDLLADAVGSAKNLV